MTEEISGRSIDMGVNTHPQGSAVVHRFGGHSMTATLRSVIVRRPGIGTDWEAFGYLHPIDQAKAEREHAAFRELLAAHGAEVIEGGPDDGLLDAIFTFDPSIITDAGAVILRMGKELRLEESAIHAEMYEELGIPILGRIKAPGTVEGGDTMWVNERLLAVGHGYRTNAEGIRQLREILAGIDVEVVAYDLPYFHGPAECMHLLSMISPLAADLAVVYKPLMAVRLVELLEEQDWRLVEIPDDEFETMGCNVLALAPGKCLALAGNPGTKARLAAAGCEVLTYEGEEISRNRFGGPTCLTRPIWRGGA
jgi:N-dimethylarginine dimethylaminohydrolase